jgi:HD-GYP domain-containing protein (c-di-GMP phosphodiesterase class II)
MTTDRSYRPARSHGAACEELRAMAGTQFDPEVVTAFLDEMGRRAIAEQDAGGDADAPLRAAAERVRALLAAP